MLTPEQKARIRKELERLGLPVGFSVRASGMRVVPKSFDVEKKAARFVATTEKPATVWDWDRWDFVDEVLRADGMELPATGNVRLLDTHSRASVKDVLGSAADFRDCDVEDQAGKDCEVIFSSVQDGRDAATKVEEGHITDVSVGYLVKESYFVPAGEKQVIKGKEYEGPLKVSTRWELRELSLVPIGADSLAKVRSLMSGPGADDGHQTSSGGKTMHTCPKCGKDFDGRHCTACGHRTEQAPGDTNRSDQGGQQTGLTPPAGGGGDGGRAGGDGGGGAGDGSEPFTAEAARTMINDAARAERQRVNEINDAVAVAGLGAEFGRSLIDQGIPMDRARTKIFDEMKRRNPAVGSGAGRSLEVENEARDKFRAAAGDGLLLRGGLRIEKPAPGSNEFRGMALIDVGRECLELAGIHTRGMGRRELAGRMLASGNSSDFPLLMSNLAGKRLLAAYNEQQATWRPFVAIGDATDFKTIHALKLSGSPDLLDLDENGEYKTANFSESGETYRVVTRGRTTKLTRVMIINDDLRAFLRIPIMFGLAARRMEADAVYSLINSNPMMSDGKLLFSADHRNIETTTKETISSAGLTAGRTGMRKQKGMAGELLDVVPTILLTPTVQETDSEVLLRSTALPNANFSSGVHNPWANKLQPVSDPRLDAASLTAWYLFADPNIYPVIEVAYLEGEQQPFIDDEIDFDSDALKIKVRHDFGAGVVDHVGGYKNPGQ